MAGWVAHRITLFASLPLPFSLTRRLSVFVRSSVETPSPLPSKFSPRPPPVLLTLAPFLFPLPNFFGRHPSHRPKRLVPAPAPFCSPLLNFNLYLSTLSRLNKLLRCIFLGRVS